MSLMSKLVGFVVILVTVGWIVLLNGGHFQLIIDLPSAVFVLGIVIGGLCMCFDPLMLITATTKALSGIGESDDTLRQRYIEMFDLGSHLAWAGGILGYFMGAVTMLNNMDSPAHIGSGMAVSLIAVLYGGFLAEVVFQPLRQMTINHGSDIQPHDSTPGKVPARRNRNQLKFIGMLLVFMSVCSFFIMIITHSEIKQQDEFDAITSEVKKAFNMNVQDPSEEQSLIQLLEEASNNDLEQQ